MRLKTGDKDRYVKRSGVNDRTLEGGGESKEGIHTGWKTGRGKVEKNQFF